MTNNNPALDDITYRDRFGVAWVSTTTAPTAQKLRLICQDDILQDGEENRVGVRRITVSTDFALEIETGSFVVARSDILGRYHDHYRVMQKQVEGKRTTFTLCSVAGGSVLQYETGKEAA